MQTCDIPPFKYQSTPQPIGDAGASSNMINEQRIELYLQQLKDAMCADLEVLEARIEALEP